jgi:phosphoribosylanthranilate isomerase
MRVGVKICGITNVEDALTAVDAGADALGFVCAESPRRVNINTLTELIASLPPFVCTVVVFRYPSREEVEAVFSCCEPNVVQAEPTLEVRNAIPPGIRLLPVFHEGEDDLGGLFGRTDINRSIPTVLLEAAGRGGRGVAPDWGIAANIARAVPLVLAGGLRPDNVREAIHRVRPQCVDVSSGVESEPGSKSPDLIRDFIAEVRRAECDLMTEARA